MKYKFIFTFTLLIILGFTTFTYATGYSEIGIYINGSILSTDVPAIISAGRTLLPVRAIFEALGLGVNYIEGTQTIIGTKEGTKIALTVDSTTAMVNDRQVPLDVAATIIKGRTMVPVLFIAESTKQNVIWDGSQRRIDITTDAVVDGGHTSEKVEVGTHTINFNGSPKTVNVVTVNLDSPEIELQVATAHDGVGGSEDFQAMITRKKPLAAINANFFDAYNSLEPYGSIIRNGEFSYLEGENTSLFIRGKNKVDMDYCKVIIRGYLDGKWRNEWNNTTQAMDFNLFDVWYVNNLPHDSTGVYIYSPARGDSIRLVTGTIIEVVNGKITKVVKNPLEAPIPPTGYLIYYGADAADDTYIEACKSL
jgi:hypothetical protein